MRKYITLSYEQILLDLSSAEEFLYEQLLQQFNGMKCAVNFIHFYTKEITRFYKVREVDPEKTILWRIANDLEQRLSKYEMPLFKNSNKRNLETVVITSNFKKVIGCRVVYEHCPVKKFVEIHNFQKISLHFSDVILFENLHLFIVFYGTA